MIDDVKDRVEDVIDDLKESESIAELKEKVCDAVEEVKEEVKESGLWAHIKSFCCCKKSNK